MSLIRSIGIYLWLWLFLADTRHISRIYGRWKNRPIDDRHTIDIKTQIRNHFRQFEIVLNFLGFVEVFLRFSTNRERFTSQCRTYENGKLKFWILFYNFSFAWLMKFYENVDWLLICYHRSFHFMEINWIKQKKMIFNLPKSFFFSIFVCLFFFQLKCDTQCDLMDSESVVLN